MNELDLDPATSLMSSNAGTTGPSVPHLSGSKPQAISLKLCSETSKAAAMMKKASSKRQPRPRPPATPPDPPPSGPGLDGLDPDGLLHRSPSPQRSYSGHSALSSRSSSPPPPSHRRRYSGSRGRSRSPSSRSSRRSGGSHRTRSRSPLGGRGSRRDPRDKSQLVVWTNQLAILGEKFLNAVFHFCDECDRPILLYGRMIPCKHVFCYPCAQRAQQESVVKCPRCSDKIARLEKCNLGTIFMCHFGGTQNGFTGCRRTYLSQRDLQAHVDTRHTKTTGVRPPQQPPGSAQAAAAAVAAAAVAAGVPPGPVPPPLPIPNPQPGGLRAPPPGLPPAPVRMPMCGVSQAPPAFVTQPVIASTAFPPPLRPPPNPAVAGPRPSPSPYSTPLQGLPPRPVPAPGLYSTPPPPVPVSSAPPNPLVSAATAGWQNRPPRPPPHQF